MGALINHNNHNPVLVFPDQAEMTQQFSLIQFRDRHIPTAIPRIIFDWSNSTTTAHQIWVYLRHNFDYSENQTNTMLGALRTISRAHLRNAVHNL